MIYEVPIDVTTVTEDGELEFDVALDGFTYRLQLSYADCAQLWYLALYLVSDTAVQTIVEGSPLVVGAPLLAAVQVEGRPAGELILEGDRDPARDELGTYARLLYYDADEVAAL